MNVALRGEAALRARLPKEAKNNAAISPSERASPETNDCSSETNDCASTTDEQVSVQGVEESDLPCTGELMQCTRNGKYFSKRLILLSFKKLSLTMRFDSMDLPGVLRWKHVKVYLNKNSQVKTRILNPSKTNFYGCQID